MAAKPDFVTVVIGDIVGSSKYADADRRRMQAHLLRSWTQTERYFRDQIDTRLGLRIAAGDEFEFVCREGTSVLQCVTFLRLKVRTLPVRPKFAFRVSIAQGHRTVRSANPYGQDGPVFHTARWNLNEMKRKSGWLTRIDADDQRGGSNRLMNAMLRVCDTIYARWTPSQARVLAAAFFDEPGEAVARRLKLTPSAVSQALRAAHWDAYREGMEVLSDLIEPN